MTPLTSMSIFGTVYVAAPVYRVVMPGAYLQYGFTGLNAGTSLPVENPPVSSGNCARTEQ
jgi:hypothetical protein